MPIQIFSGKIHRMSMAVMAFAMAITITGSFFTAGGTAHADVPSEVY